MSNHPSKNKAAKKLHALAGVGMFEPLEPRVMLNADFSMSAFAPLPAQLSGTSQVVQFTLQNSSGAASKGSVTANLFAIPDGTYDAGTFNPAAARALNTAKLSAAVPAAGSVVQPLPIALGANLAAGNYQIVAKLSGKGIDTAFVVSGTLTVGQPDYDLVPVPVVAKTVVPAALVANSGKATKGSVQVQLSNPGSSTATIPAKLTAAVQVLLRRDGQADRVLNAKAGVAAIGGLAPGASSKPTTLSILLPGDLAPGSYQVVVKIDTTNNLAETNENNNEIVVKTVAVADPFVDLAVAVDDAKSVLPAGVVISGSAAAKVALTVNTTNNGNVPSGATQTVDASIAVKPVGGGAPVATIPVPGLKLAKLVPNKPLPLKLAFNLPAGIPDGDYLLDVTLTGVAGDNLADNTDTTDASHPIHVQEGRIVLALATASTDVAASVVGGSNGTGSVTFRNDGNVPLVGQVKVQFYASTTQSINGLSPIGEATVAANLAAGATLAKPVTVNLVLPNPGSTTSYNLIAVVSAVNFTDVGLPAGHTMGAGAVSVSHFTPIFPDAVGDKITFHATQTIDGAGQFQQSGTFVGSNGATGDYNMTYTGGTFNGQTFPESGLLGLMGSTIALRQIKFYSHHGVSFSGKTVTFNYVSAGAIGEITGFEGGVIGYIHF